MRLLNIIGSFGTAVKLSKFRGDLNSEEVAKGGYTVLIGPVI